MPAIGELLKKAREFSWFALIFLLSACGGGGSRGSPDQLPVGLPRFALSRSMQA